MKLEPAARAAARGIVTFAVALLVLIFVGGALVVVLGGNLGPTLLILFTVIAIGVAVVAVRWSR